MGEYTVKNLREVEDQAPRFGLAPNLSGRFASTDLELEQNGVSLQRLAPGFRMPFGHNHERQEEVYVIVAGSARVKIGEDVVDLEQWDALRVSPQTMRAFEAGPNGCELIAFGAPRDPAAPDVEMVQGWWAD